MDAYMNASGTNLAKTIAGVMSSAEPGSYGPMLRGILVALTASRTRERTHHMDTRGYQFRALAELVENAVVYAERNDL